jgi:hypothetical protein
MQRFYTSERYLELVERNRRRDLVGVRRLIGSAIAETEAEEKGFWLLVRAGWMCTLPVPPVATIMSDVRSALSLAPGDPGIEEGALLTVLALGVCAERVEDGPRWVSMLRRVLRQADEPFMLWCNLGTLQWRRMRPRAAVRSYSRTLTGMYLMPPERQRANQTRFYVVHCYRALAAIEAGMTELADRDIETAQALLPTLPLAEDIFLCLAQSAAALAARDIGLARQRLQWIRVQDQAGKYLRSAQWIRAEVELQAARIALAEGNRQAFDHFTGRAIAMAREHQLALTERRITQIRTRVLGKDVAVEV